ncbi:Helicase associated domain protein [Streptomyces sp. NPDC001380]|uniref:DEAD/DEAH box helicase n=1 Tax=Streptomyces sp. NPDC001380 TaxID=3364566 RepID=UPI00367FB827
MTITLDGLDDPAPSGRVRLRGHQEEAVAAIVRALSPAPGMGVLASGLRATVQMATGSGKSFVGAVAAARLAPQGPVLVVVPTLDLLAQMIGAWRAAGRPGEAYAVCSLERGEVPAGVSVSTAPLMLAYWLRARRRPVPITLYATYASVGAVADAYAAAAERGEVLAPLELMVCDEAHRTSGSLAKRWAVVHDQTAIPAVRRLYMTATPRVWEPPRSRVREGAVQPLGEGVVCSMDDPALYGRTVYCLGLAEAIDRRLLAPFEVVVLELRAPEQHADLAARQPVPWGPGVGEDEGGEGDEVRPARVAAIQAGLLRAAAERGLRKTITFHHRTIEARYFSETLNQTAERLWLEDPGTYYEEVWAQWLAGEHDAGFRAAIIREFAQAGEGDGIPYAVMSNCRVLGEGVDIPAADSVLLQGRGSMVDIVQAIGRALRMQPGEGKTASLIVPVFLADGEEPGDLLGSRSYEPLVRILTAIRAHDAKVVETLAVPQRPGGRTTGRSAESAVAPGQGAHGEVGGVPSFTLPVRFQTPPEPDVLALFVNLRVLTGESQYWREGITAARAWHAEHGGLDVPYSGVVGDFPLGRWLSEKRAEHAAGTLAGHRVLMLDQLGMVWDVSDQRWQAGLDWAREWAAAHHGSLAAPARAWLGGYAVGAWLAAARAAATRPVGAPGALPEGRRRQLEAIDPWWCPAWPIAWQRACTAARAWWLASHGQVDWAALPADAAVDGEAIGRWVPAQRAAWSDLDPGQRELLAALGIEEDPQAARERARRVAKAAARPGLSREQRFAQGLEAVRAFHAREGHLRVPRAHQEPVTGPDGGVTTVALGVWVNNTRARRDKLSPEQTAALDALDIRW